jgi:hypothetical protein
MIGVKMLKHLTKADVHAIIEAAEKSNSAHPPRELGSSLEEARERRSRPDPEGDVLKAAIKKLSPEARVELVALMWVGRGDVEGSFADHLRQAQRDSHPVDYIVEKSPALPRYLRQGLKKLASEGSSGPSKA